MNSVKVKICGVRTIEAAEVAVKAGADFLGFNFVNESRRFINPLRAKEIIDKVHKKVTVVGIFQNHTVEEVNELVHFLGLHAVQLHGEEDSSFVSQIKAKVTKAVHLPEDFTLSETLANFQSYNAHHLLIDRRIQGQGPMLDAEMVYQISQIMPVFLAGGLHHENVAELVAKARPFAVDVAGGVETHGEQDLDKVEAFIKNAKSVRLS